MLCVRNERVYAYCITHPNILSVTIFRSWMFTWWEMGMLKVCLISLGILLGLYFREYLVGLTLLW